MIYLSIMGNAGNQFFQYAFARMLQEKYGGDLIIDYSDVHFDESGWPDSDNLLSHFNTIPYEYTLSGGRNPHRIILKIIRKGEGLLNLKPYTKKNYFYYRFCARLFEGFGVYYYGSGYYPFKFPRQKDIFVKGYFESPRYFESIDRQICNELTPRHKLQNQNESLYSLICSQESVCVSIKRRDIENSDVNIKSVYKYDIKYFYNAVDYVRSRIQNPVWIIFSDNISWCRDHFHIKGNVYYETSNNPVWEKIQLMSACKHFIIHNSTFSWWAQHLSDNKNKIVVCPAKWTQRNDQPIDIYESNFVFMDDDGNVLNQHL